MSGCGRSALHVPTTFWARSDVLDALGDRDFSQLFMLLRRYTGASQTRIGAAIDLSQGTVSDVVRGKRRITAIDVVVRLADGLGMPESARQRLGLAATIPRMAVPTSAGPQGADADGLSQVVTFASVGARDVDYLEQSILASVAKYPVTGPEQVWPGVAATMARLENVLRHPQRLSIQRRCVALIGVAAGVAGNVWVDIGQPRRASGYFDLGRVAGYEANDYDLAAWATALESIHPFYSQQANVAASLLDQAGELARGRSGPRRRAWISALRARAYASSEPDVALAALDDAFRLLDDAPPPEGTEFFDMPRLYALAGTTYLIVGDHNRAADVTSKALTQRPASDVKGRTLATLDLAAVRVAQGQVEEACRLVAHALDLQDGRVITPILARANEVVTGMAPWRSTACVRAASERLRAHGGRTGRRELRALGRPQLPGRLPQ